ncbi:glutathione S-transferase family protein [Dongia rigui]|uniref:Glutathione S-transferase family protein n=1 Tax=Dongia rigui TaxID=940149 RepID=A0ABU5DWU9_9PROT|nr:glutathione S-transferase family protein [Dongia rigui]MDY0871749.1 glutathione S-transferase family protein [Dongia rigui]
MLTLYDSAISGNAYKVRLLLSHLGIPLKRIEMNVDDGSTRTPDFLKVNRNGKVPAIVLEDGTALSESDAILYYFAEGTRYWPSDRLGRARVLQWMFFEQYNHEPTIAVVRHWVAHLGKTPESEPALPAKIAAGYLALDVMEDQLQRSDYFVGNSYTIADIALYAYSHVAHEGGFDLGRYPAIGAWLKRVAAQPGHIRITD